MRGGLSYTEAMALSAGERDAFSRFLNKRMEEYSKNPKAIIAV